MIAKNESRARPSANYFGTLLAVLSRRGTTALSHGRKATVENDREAPSAGCGPTRAPQRVGDRVRARSGLAGHRAVETELPIGVESAGVRTPVRQRDHAGFQHL
jgi:hypothetical protein